MKKDLTLADLVKTKREEIGLSQRRLAMLIGMNSGEMSRLEAGTRKRINITYLIGMSNIFKVKLNKLMKLAGYSKEEIIQFDAFISGEPVDKYIEVYGKYIELDGALEEACDQINNMEYVCSMLSDIAEEISFPMTIMELDNGDYLKILENMQTLKVMFSKLKEALDSLDDLLYVTASNTHYEDDCSDVFKE